MPPAASSTLTRKGLGTASATPKQSIKLAPEGIVTAIVSVTGIEDSVKDLIVPGAFAATLAYRRPKVVDDHEWGNRAGRVLHIAEWLPGDKRLPKFTKDGKPWPAEAGALVATMQYAMEIEEGYKSYQWVKFYAESNEAEFSIGYRVPEPHARKRRDGVRVILQVDLFEISHVLFGAAPLSMALEVKSALGAKAPVKRATTPGLDAEDEAAYGDASVAPSPETPWDEKPRAHMECKTAASVVLETKGGGWDRNEGNAENLRKWFVAGGDGAIPWGSPGDFDACVAIASKHMTADQAKGYCNLRHHEALGIYPATHAKLEGKTAMSTLMEAKSMNTMKGSYQERTEAIECAVIELFGDADFVGVVATYDSEAIVNVFTSGEPKSYLVPYTLDPDTGDAALGDPEQVALSLVAEGVDADGDFDGDTGDDDAEEAATDFTVVEPLAASIRHNEQLLGVLEGKTAQRVRARVAELEQKSAEATNADFTADNLPDDGWAEYRKTEPIEAQHIDHPFSVSTREGVVSIDDETGGWLAIDSDGYPYPIADDEFANVYAPTGAGEAAEDPAEESTETPTAEAAEPTPDPVADPVADPDSDGDTAGDTDNDNDGSDDPANYEDQHADEANTVGAEGDSESTPPIETKAADANGMVTLSPDEHFAFMDGLDATLDNS